MLRILLPALIFSLSFFTATSQLKFEEIETLLADFEPNYLKIEDANDDALDDILVSSKNENFITLFFQDGGFVPMNIIVGESASRRGIGIGDFDGDGITDLAVTDMTMNRVSILLGSGESKFAEPAYFSTGDLPVDIATQDIDDDGDLDLLVANSGESTVSVLLNDGSGDFSSLSTVSVQSEPETVKCEDLNADNIADLVVANKGSGSISFLFGNGDGTFETAINHSVAASPSEVQIGDFNTDGVKDIVVVHDEGTSVSILYGEGMKEFADVESISVGFATSPGVFTAADLNEDTTLDIAINAKNERNTIILLNDGLGNFNESTADVGGSGGTLLSDVIAADLFGDGDLGLVSTNSRSFMISITLGDGTGSFGGRYREIHTTPSPYRMTSQDFNGDGYDDLAVANFFAGFMTVFINDGMKGFKPAFNRGEMALSTSAINSGDLDNDGFFDIVVGNAGEILVFYGDESGEFEETKSFNIFLGNADCELSDINDDGNLDIVAITGAHLGDGNRSFTFSHNFTLPEGGPLDMTVCDINNDGFLDQIATDRFNDRIIIHAGNGDGTFGTAAELAVGDQPFGVTSSDFNNDNIDDLAVSHLEDGSMTIILGTSSTLAVSSVIANDNPFDPNPLHSLDINNDENADIIAIDDKIYIYLGDGTGSFEVEELSTTFNPQDLAFIDIDKNGLLDILVGTQQTGIALTLHLADIEPSTGSSNLVFSQIGESSATLTWDNGSGEERIVVAKAILEVGGLPADNAAYEANAEFGMGSEIGVGNFVLYQGTGSTFEVTGLEKGTEYHFAVVDFNKKESNSVYNYLTDAPLRGNITTVVNEPLTAATDLMFVGSNELSWTNGSGDGRLVLAKQGTAVDGLPEDNTIYEANSDFGLGSELGNDSFVLYNGSENSVSIDGLDATQYHFAVFEYNVNADNTIINYLTSEFLTGDFTVLNIDEKASDIKVYPNPTAEKISISLKASTKVDVRISDLSGKLIDVEPLLKTTSLVEFDLGSLKRGFYLIEVNTDGESTVRRIFKQ